MTTDPAALAAQLQQSIADLDGYIERRAGELAAPLIAHAQGDAQAQVEALRGELRARDDLVAELRRQLDCQLRQVAQLRWAARYLPAALRALVLGPDPARRGGWRGDRPEDRFVALADAAASSAGANAYPDR